MVIGFKLKKNQSMKRIAALAKWNTLPLREQSILLANSNIVGKEDRLLSSLTGREIEEILSTENEKINFTSDSLLKLIRLHGIENCKFLVPMKPLRNAFFVKYTSSSDDDVIVPAIIVEERYKIEANYKIELCSIYKEFGKESYYVSDLVKLINDGIIEFSVKPTDSTLALISKYQKRLNTLKTNRSRGSNENWSDADFQECDRLCELTAEILADLKTI